MAGKRLEIMDIRQIITLKQKGWSNRKVVFHLSVSRNTVNGYLQRFEKLDLSFDQALKLSESDLLDLFPVKDETEVWQLKPQNAPRPL